ncbi:hypothetical protein WJX72_004168 [[Myrmecia] bisecta]|uniref:Uncharacterized protein n=1 Tax=[Myrmecia] bisecta TaxID=41462 RepID=A0AAW1QQX3_9CHLO
MQHVRNTAEATLILDVGRKAAEVDMLTGFAAQQGQHLQPWQATGQAVQGLAAVYAQLRAVISELEQLASRLKVYADVNASMHEELRLQGVSMQLVFDKLFLSRVETELAARCLAVCQQGSQVQMQPLLQGLREIEVGCLVQSRLPHPELRGQSGSIDLAPERQI